MLSPATAAQADEPVCDFSMSTSKYSCSGSSAVRKPTDVIGARIFSGEGFQGRELTIWVPTQCPKDNRVNWFLVLGDELKMHVGSVQGWADCWVWLYRRDGSREGPFRSDVPDVSQDGGDQAVRVGLS
ncbi:hypothetical protein C5D18_07215 [Rathayibacter tritici]|nr:hypothetical protein C5D18_07215 [Rathayibacter tritici]